MNFQNFCSGWLQFLVILTFCLHGVQSSNCGGVLKAAFGIVEHSIPPGDNSQRCLWVIELPVTSSIIRFHLRKIPAFSQLSLYPQEGHTVGQTTVLPIALTSTNESVSLTTRSSSMVVVWAPTDNDFDNKVTSSLTFEWEGVEGQGQGENSGWVGGISFLEGQEGKFSWVKAGVGQQSLLWLLNSDDHGNLVSLTTETDFDHCDLISPCLCSYLGIYQIHDTFLQEVTTECAKVFKETFEGLERPLLALGSVNPKYQSGRSFVSFSWNSGQRNETTTEKSSTTTSPTTEEPTTCSTGQPKSCAEIQSTGFGFNTTQFCSIYPFGPEDEAVQVLCDFKTEWGGWTVIQKRGPGPKEEFYRNWTDYEEGFGSVDRNYWLGLKTIHALTKDGDQELRIDLWDFEGNHAYAKYSNFSISNSSDFYRLTIGGYTGTAGDSMMLSYNLNGMQFSTKDKENDQHATLHCAEYRRGAWWYNNCAASNLNGLYYEKGETQNPQYSGMAWYHWKNSWRFLQQTELKVRPRL